MSQTVPLKDAVDALRSFNNAIVTSRLYPPAAPQVASAVEHGYKGLHLFLVQYGKLEITVKEKKPFLDQFLLEDDILSSFSNLLVYRQMAHLEVDRLVFDASLDKFAFGQIVSVFTARVDKIRKEGGGTEYITSFGLAKYFPEPGADEVGEPLVSVGEKIRPKKLLKVDSALLAAIFSKKDDPDDRQKLAGGMRDKDQAVELLAAAIGNILRELHKKKTMHRTSVFPHVLSRCEQFIATDDRRDVAPVLGRVLVDSLKDPALCVLLLQEYPDGFGMNLHDAVLNCLDSERLGNIIVLLRGQLAAADAGERGDDAFAGIINQQLMQLTNSEKGRQFIGSETARKVLQEGERSRRKQRIQTGIRGILQGSVSPWQSAELLEHLPFAVSQMAASTGSTQLEILLQKLVNQLDSSKTADQSQLLNVLIFTSEKLVLEERWNYADPLLDRLLKWVGETERSDEFLERAVILLERAMQHYWRSGEELHGDTIQKMFYRIRTGSLPKTAIAKAIAGHAQDRGIERSSLPDLLQKCFLEPHNDLLSCRLIFQGPVATRFLVETLIETQDTAHRYKIIDLLTSFGDPLAAEIVQERITEHMPWYGKCNLLKLLTAAGDKDDADAALPFLNHKDFRVQREAFLCLYKIGGRRRRELLLRALANSSELIKIQIINALVRFPDPEVGDHLAKWLTEYDSFSEKNRDALLMQLLDTLAGCPCPSAEKAVQDFLKNRGRRAGRKIPEPVWEEAEKTMNLLESNQKRAKKSHVQASQLRKDAIRQAVKRGKTAPGERIITGLAEEQAIRMLLGSGEEEKAREKLVQLIGQTTQTRNYVQAEKLREWLIDINETAIGDIIRTAEIISHRKVAAVDSTHLEIWKELYEYLTTEEFDALYQSLQQKKYENEEIVVHQGALQTALYFINSGTVKLFFRDKGNRVLIKTMGKGEIIGSGSFFDASVWTVSVASVGISDISLLRHEKMHQWKEEFPGLEQKLRDFCSNFETIEHILSQSAQDRRQHNRYTVSGQVTTLLLDNSGQATGVSSEVELCDISQSGVSYYLQIPRRENARLILGRKVKIILPSTGSGAQEGGVIGDILAVKMRPGLDSGYSIHVRFDTEISSLQLDEIVMIFDGKSTTL